MTGDVGIAGAIGADAVSIVRIRTAQEGGVDEGGARRIQLRYKDVVKAAGRTLNRGAGERSRESGTGHIQIAGAIDENSAPELVSAAAQERGIDKSPGRIDLRKEDVLASLVRGLHDARSNRKRNRVCPTYDEDISGPADRDPADPLLILSSEISRVEARRPGGVDPHYEPIGEEAGRRLSCARRDWKVFRIGQPADEDVTAAIGGNRVAIIFQAAAGHGREHQGRAGRVQLGDEYLVSLDRFRKSARGYWECRIGGGTANVCVPGRVGCDAVSAEKLPVPVPRNVE